MSLDKSNIELREVSEEDFNFLYALLKNREPLTNISHKKMPTFDEHVKFVKSKPYHIWYVIYFEHDKVGSVYLTKQDEIGIFLNKDFQKKGIASIALKLLIKKHPRKRYLANTSTQNTKSIEFFKKQGFKIIQHTFELLT